MKLCRYNDNQIGIVRADGVHNITTIVDKLEPHRHPFPLGDALIANLESLRDEMEALADSATPVPISQVKLLSPVANPSKIIGTPQNYEAHALEATADLTISQGKQRRPLKDQGLFLKATSSLVGAGEGINIRFPDRRTDHEAELGVVIGKPCSQVTPDEALSFVAGYAAALDMVVRGPEDRSFRKSIDTYSVLGPWLITSDELPAPSSFPFTLSVNGELRQSAHTSEMILSVEEQISWASQYYTLLPGDIIMTGTCDGVGPVRPGDTIDIRFEGLAQMQVGVS
ncbi:fumarylacetoacetate hydrolase family protein [Hoeflea sp. CAU 1731]